MQETRVLSRGGEELLGRGMATRSSTLAWEIPWTEELGGLQSVGLQQSLTQEWVFLCFFANTHIVKVLNL